MLAGCGGAAKVATPPPLVLGALFSTSGSGSSIGPQQAAGARLAVRTLNEAGGVDGAPLRLVIRDDQTDVARAKTLTRDLVDTSHALALLGPTLSIVAVAVDPVADGLRTPVVAISNTAHGIVGDCPYACTWIWRASLGEAAAVPANVSAYVAAEHPASAALVSTQPDLLAAEETQNAARAFRSGGVRISARVALAAGVPVDASVRRALAGDPGALFVGSSFGDTIAEVIRAARAQGFAGTILSGNVLNSATAARLAGSAGAGARTGVAWVASNRFPANADFVRAYERAYGAEPDVFAAQAYTGVLILADALRRAKLAGSTAPVEEQRARLQRALGEVALTTPLGPFRFTHDHDVRQIIWLRALDGAGGNRLIGFCDPDC